MQSYRIMLSLLFLGTTVVVAVPAQEKEPRPVLLVVVPGRDTVVTPLSAHRLSGSTIPGHTVTLNGRPLKVYASGAFVSLMPLAVGENSFSVEVRKDDRVVEAKKLLFLRTPPLQTTPRESLRVEDVLLEPSTERWLNVGDILTIQCKGTPGCVAIAMDSLPLQELPETRGIGGIYRGTYVIRATDRWDRRPVTIVLRDSAGNGVQKEARGSVTTISERMPVVGETTGERPYLNFGLGDDRLGGAKFAFLPAGVRMLITGKEKDQYRVALAPGQEAWIPENMVTVLSAGTPPPSSLTGSWTVSGDRRFDYVTVTLSEKLPFSSFVEYQPTRICIDVYGAVSNSNWITQHLTAKEIRNVSYQQVGAQVFRIILELEHRQVWGYEIGYRGNALQVRVRRPPASAAWENLTIALDAGHGGSNEGALGSTGLKEKDVNLAAVLRLKEILEDRGARVVLTRPDDRELPNSERLKTVLSSDADILLSVHSNSIGDGSNPEVVRGTSTYYRYLCYRPLSLFIYEELLGTGLLPFGNVGGFNFTLNSPTELPNALVELAFMSNPEDEMLLMDGENLTLFAEKIVDGLERFLEQSQE